MEFHIKRFFIDVILVSPTIIASFYYAYIKPKKISKEYTADNQTQIDHAKVKHNKIYSWILLLLIFVLLLIDLLR